MGVGGVGIETLVLYLIYNVGAVGEELVFDPVELVAHDKSLQLHAKLAGKLATLGEEFKADIGHLAILVFAINYQVVIILHDCRILEPAV